MAADNLITYMGKTGKMSLAPKPGKEKEEGTKIQVSSKFSHLTALLVLEHQI